MLLYLCPISTSQPYLETDLDKIAAFAVARTEENDQFALLLKSMSHETLDPLVQDLNDLITPGISCTDCGNCCRTLMINVSETEAEELSAHLQLDRDLFDTRYLEKGSNGMMLVNTIPCHFLDGNKCAVYAHRFGGCREFPAMHLPHFRNRLFTTFMHYGRCPIIFNIIEQLKTKLLSAV